MRDPDLLDSEAHCHLDSVSSIFNECQNRPDLTVNIGIESNSPNDSPEIIAQPEIILPPLVVSAVSQSANQRLTILGDHPLNAKNDQIPNCLAQ